MDVMEGMFIDVVTVRDNKVIHARKFWSGRFKNGISFAGVSGANVNSVDVQHNHLARSAHARDS